MFKILISTAFVIFSLSANAKSAVSLDDISWMAGNWIAHHGPMQGQAHYSTAVGGVILGQIKLLEVPKDREPSFAAKLLHYEFLTFKKQGDDLVLEIFPKDQAAMKFPSTSIKSNSAVFENLKHDFPKRLIYEKLTDNLVKETTSGIIDGKWVFFSHLYQRRN